MKKSIRFIAFTLICLFMFASCSAAKDAEGWNEGAQFAPEASDKADSITNEEESPDMDYSKEEIPEDSYLDSNKVIENPFVSTSAEPTSTFSADVDTASYAYFRKMVDQGYSFEEIKNYFGYSARTEEFVNYFDYDYALPENGELFGRTVTVADCPWNPETKLVRVGLATVATEIQTKNNLVFLIDVSGSMNSDDKLPLLKKTFKYLTEQLGEDDKVSIVTYSGREAVVLEGCSGAKQDKILNAVNNLSASGSTHGEAGLKKAYELAEANFIPDGNNRIIMASDGDLNVGISSADELKSFVEGKRAQGVYLSVLGFGTGNFRDSRMEALADNGNGVYYYIDGEREAEKIFGEDLFATLYTVASDVKLQITFDAASVSDYRLIGYENRRMANEDFDNDLKDAGEVGAGHIFTVFYEIKMNDKAVEEKSDSWFTLAMRYKNPGELQSLEKEYKYGYECYTVSPDKDLVFAANVVRFVMMLHNSEYMAENIELSGIIEELEALELSDEYQKEFVGLLEKLLMAK